MFEMFKERFVSWKSLKIECIESLSLKPFRAWAG